jgi:hypothetical protein
MSFQQPQQPAQCALFQIAASFISTLRRSRKDVVDGHYDRCGLAGTMPMNRAQPGIIKEECSAKLLRRAEMPTVHNIFLKYRFVRATAENEEYCLAF